jgi:hypothetical protein
LPLLATPPPPEKPEALRAGWAAIQTYLAESEDSPEQKAKAAGMAVEALLIWVHPFDDGNGRTSRFFGKFIEDGTVDIEELIVSTADRLRRMREYDDFLRIDKANIYEWLGDWIANRPSDAELRPTEMSYAEGIARSLIKLLADKALQAVIEENTRAKKERYVEFLRRRVDRESQETHQDLHR